MNHSARSLYTANVRLTLHEVPDADAAVDALRVAGERPQAGLIQADLIHGGTVSREGEPAAQKAVWPIPKYR